MLFAAPPSLLSSVDLISVVDDPFSSRLEAMGRDGWSQAGSQTAVCMTGSRLWKSLFGCIDVPNWALASYRGEKKMPQEPGFSGNKGRMLETGLHKPPQFKFLWPETPSAESNYY